MLHSGVFSLAFETIRAGAGGTRRRFAANKVTTSLHHRLLSSSVSGRIRLSELSQIRKKLESRRRLLGSVPGYVAIPDDLDGCVYLKSERWFDGVFRDRKRPAHAMSRPTEPQFLLRKAKLPPR